MTARREVFATFGDCFVSGMSIERSHRFDFLIACAVNQVMAIATLDEVYNNPEVFRGVVKIRKGLACRMILESGDLEGIFAWFNKLSSAIAKRVPASDPCASRTAEVCKIAMEMTNPSGKADAMSGRTWVILALPVLLSAAYVYRR